MSQTEVQLIKSSSVVDGDIVGMSSSKLTGTLPALSAANLTNLPAANLTGTLPAISGANLTGISAGITQADQWRITANFDTSSDFITANWERNDTTSGYIGSGMSESSGVFTFPATGIYHVIAFARGNGLGNTVFYSGIEIHTTPDNSTYSNVADSYDSMGFTNGYMAVNAQTFFDVTSTSTHKVKIKVTAANSFRFSGSSTKNETGVTFIRLGDT